MKLLPDCPGQIAQIWIRNSKNENVEALSFYHADCIKIDFNIESP